MFFVVIETSRADEQLDHGELQLDSHLQEQHLVAAQRQAGEHGSRHRSLIRQQDVRGVRVEITQGDIHVTYLTENGRFI